MSKCDTIAMEARKTSGRAALLDDERENGGKQKLGFCEHRRSPALKDHT